MRLVYLVTGAGKTGTDEDRSAGPGMPPGNISLSRVRLGITGIEHLHEGQIVSGGHIATHSLKTGGLFTGGTIRA
jgi:hypothetical protein